MVLRCGCEPAQARLLLVACAAMLAGRFQFYHEAVLSNLYRPIMAWLRANIEDDAGWQMSPESVQTEATHQYALLSASFDSGVIISAPFLLLTGSQNSALGRVRALTLLAMLSTANAFMYLVSYHVRSFLLLVLTRVLSGLLTGTSSNMSSLLLGEIAPLHIRGQLLSAQVVAVMLSSNLAMLLSMPAILGASELWPYAMAAGSLPVVLSVGVFLFVPDSPRHLFLSKHNESACRRSLEFYQGAARVDEVMEELHSEGRLNVNRDSLWRSVTSGANGTGPRRILLVVLILGCSRVGVLLVAVHTTFILNHFTPSYNTAATLATLITVAVSIPTVLLPRYIGRMVRRPIMFLSPAILALGFLSLIALHWNPIHAVGVASLYSLLPMCDAWGFQWGLAPFVIVGLLVSVMCWWLTPETKGQTYEQIYRRHFASADEAHEGYRDLDEDAEECLVDDDSIGYDRDMVL